MYQTLKRMSWLGLLAMLLSTSVFATDVRVLALFPGKALVEIDGKQKFMRVGKAAFGVKLLSSNSKQGVFEFDGVKKTLKVGGRSSYSKPAAAGVGVEARITRSTDGHYRTTATINGRTVDVMVDTGATTIAMSSVEAKRLGIQYRLSGTPAKVSTANGLADGYAIKLSKVNIGGITLRNVAAFVIDGSSPRTVLLGMSYLNNVKMEYQNNLLILRKKF